MALTDPIFDTSALITMDTQNDFTLPNAPMHIAGTCEIVPNMVKLLAWYREGKLPIVHIVRLYLADGSNADLCRRELITAGKHIAVPGSDGAELVPELKPEPGLRLDAELLLSGGVQQFSEKEVIIYKPRFGAFYQTPLDQHLREQRVDTLVFCGCNYPNCPRTSIYEASERDFRIVLVADAVSGLYEKGRQEMSNIGVHLMPTNAFSNLI